jgi:hypothetical protein
MPSQKAIYLSSALTLFLKCFHESKNRLQASFKLRQQRPLHFTRKLRKPASRLTPQLSIIVGLPVDNRLLMALVEILKALSKQPWNFRKQVLGRRRKGLIKPCIEDDQPGQPR